MQVFPASGAVTRFGPRFDPVGSVALGERFVLETADCYDGQFTSADVLRPDIDMARFNRATGPVRVDGVEVGDGVVVRVERIDVRGPGVMAVAPGLGVLGGQVAQPSTRLLPVRDGHAWLTPQIGVPLAPMVGILGIATAAETVATSVPGAHGGNLDTRLLREGAAVAFRAHQPGLGLAAGDVHAAMGDGELGGTGIEIAGRVQLSVERYTGPVGSWPLLFADDAAHVLASAADVDTAVRAGFGEAVALVAGAHGLAWPDAYRLASVVCDVQVSQLVNPRVTVRVRVPRRWCPGVWPEA
ncbi:MAG TPA: acetamidase/formamidase family protein [Pseudonocardia sp.]|uniref:acetamidase/formamidase family protein n=1 Tax=Pseudonocardia sp. TaxID=60912 RepID=UPI002B4B5FE6|nr:acetamidase/formamidase family protein [Pseudonocardia sp.]HLU54095.1 acetamidase/formamidase family protein [Pseudonocardia sp.]